VRNFSYLISRIATRHIALAITVFFAQGCASLSCDDYTSYDDILESWIGADLDSYERQNNDLALSVALHHFTQLEYEYDTPYTSYDGSQIFCKTWLLVDKSSGKIVSWYYEGECDVHGYCSNW